MKKHLSLLSLALLVVFAQTSIAKEAPATLVARAVSDNATESAAAIAELRAIGPIGLQSLMEANEQEIRKHITNPALAPTSEWLRITAALDAVSQQKDSYLSGLFWYKDLDEARKAATLAHKPILSLRLLGKLTDELSCANSRFFRTVLYSNAAVSSSLRDRFILHWESVRSAPVITIDFGDGRKLQRTITGNSIHYVLDSDGKLIDALPGLYGPGAFMRGLNEALTVFKQMSSDPENRLVTLATYYRTRINKISVDWLNDATKIGLKQPLDIAVERNENGEALSILPLAVSKAMTERTMLRAMTAGADSLGRITDETAWTKIAALHKGDSTLDERSIGLIKRQTRLFTDSAKVFDTLLQRFQDSIAMDTVRNEYRMHTKLYASLTADRGRSDVKAFNEKVYAELFITPRSDPWLGLLQPDVYTGLENGGVINN
jgi:hypothetical protein